MIAIIDCGMGNLNSVAKACAALGTKAVVTASASQVQKASALIFPGVGAFGEAMRELKRRKLVQPILEAVEREKPFLGLCLGLQLLFASSEESPGVKGLAVFPGRVRKLPGGKNLKVPHMGWNQVERARSLNGEKNPLLAGIPDEVFMYFVHSFYADPKEAKVVVGWTRHGIRFPSVIWNGKKVWATQFHPEKSQKWGLKIVSNFLKELRS